MRLGELDRGRGDADRRVDSVDVLAGARERSGGGREDAKLGHDAPATSPTELALPSNGSWRGNVADRPKQ